MPFQINVFLSIPFTSILKEKGFMWKNSCFNLYFILVNFYIDSVVK